MRFEKPSEIQASTLPLILEGHNVIAQAQSGAGKTIAFVIGMLAKVNLNHHSPQALCLTPTRELANQILSDAVRPLSSRLRVTYEDALPGRDVMPGQVCRSQVIVGTPGTVKRWVMKGYLDPATLSIFVLDEADKMVEEKALGKFLCTAITASELFRIKERLTELSSFQTHSFHQAPTLFSSARNFTTTCRFCSSPPPTPPRSSHSRAPSCLEPTW